jgi:hypothetical protein
VGEEERVSECRDALRELLFDLPDKLPPGLSSPAVFSGRGSSRSKVRNDEIRL